MEPRRLLIVTSKWPGKTDSSDGGNSTVRELIDILNRQYLIDILYFGKHAESEPREDVHEVFYCEVDFDHYEAYSATDYSKFIIRVKQSSISAEIIHNHAGEYERIIVIHNMFLLGIDPSNEELLKKIILFPMFTGEDYQLSGENVPESYISEEKQLMRKVKAVVVPSHREKSTLTELYGIHGDLIHIIHRCVDRFPYKEHIITSDRILIVYVASIRKQKAHVDAVFLLKKLRSLQINASLKCIGAIQDQEIYKHCLKLAEDLGMSAYVSFTGNLEYAELSDYLRKSDFNISVSQWETFGRGIFEGLAAGVPTVVLDRIESIDDIATTETSPVRCKNTDEMAACIYEMMKDPKLYSLESRKGQLLRESLSTITVKDRLCKVLE